MRALTRGLRDMLDEGADEHEAGLRGTLALAYKALDHTDTSHIKH